MTSDKDSSGKVNARALLVVRIRGTVNVPRGTEKTLRMLHLFKKHTATIVPDNPVYKGMLQVAKDYVSWSPADSTIVEAIVKNRGETVGGSQVDSDDLKTWGFASIKSLCSSLSKGEVHLKNLQGLKPFFRLHPPRGGFKKSIRRGGAEGGVLGEYQQLPTLAERMIG